MRILLLTQWYPPEPVKLIGELAESLHLLGHDVEVLTGFPNYPQGVLYPGYRLRLVQREEHAGVRITRVPLFCDHSHSSWKRVANYLSFSVAAAVLGMIFTRRPDVIFVYGSPYTSALPAWLHSRIRRVPFVFNLQDLWPDSLRASGMIRSESVLLFVAAFARFVYRASARVVTISEGIRNRLLNDGVPSGKVTVASNWVDTELFKPMAADAALRETYGLSGRINFLFAGNIGPAQGLETLIDAAARLRGRRDLQFVIAGDGVSLPSLRDRAERLGANNVRFLGRLPETTMPALFASVEALVVTLKPDPLFEITVPHKIFAYMATAKPVVAAVAGDAAAIVVGARAGVACAPGNAAALARSVEEIAALSAEERAALGANGRRTMCELYSRDYLVRKIADVLGEVVGIRTPGPSSQNSYV